MMSPGRDSTMLILAMVDGARDHDGVESSIDLIKIPAPIHLPNPFDFDNTRKTELPQLSLSADEAKPIALKAFPAAVDSPIVDSMKVSTLILTPNLEISCAPSLSLSAAQQEPTTTTVKSLVYGESKREGGSLQESTASSLEVLRPEPTSPKPLVDEPSCPETVRRSVKFSGVYEQLDETDLGILSDAEKQCDTAQLDPKSYDARLAKAIHEMRKKIGYREAWGAPFKAEMNVHIQALAEEKVFLNYCASPQSIPDFPAGLIKGTSFNRPLINGKYDEDGMYEDLRRRIANVKKLARRTTPLSCSIWFSSPDDETTPIPTNSTPCLRRATSTP